MLILLFLWNYTTHTTLWIWHITFISRYQVHVAMEHALACSFVYVYTNIIAVRMESFIYLLFNVLQNYIHGLTLMVSQVEIVGNMPLGDDKRMAWADGIAIVESNTSCGLANNLYATGKLTERTGFSFLARKFVEVVILIQLVALIRNKTLIWQFYITLICILLMNSVKPKAFFCKVTAHGKVGSTLWRKEIGHVHQYFSLRVWLQHV